MNNDAAFVALRVNQEELDALVKVFGGEHQRDPEKLTPAARVALRIVTAAITEPGTCMICGCTDDDCRGCIERTGVPCSWVNERETLCSACVS